jgi:hypothetical protein
MTETDVSYTFLDFLVSNRIVAVIQITKRDKTGFHHEYLSLTDGLFGSLKDATVFQGGDEEHWSLEHACTVVGDLKMYLNVAIELYSPKTGFGIIADFTSEDLAEEVTSPRVRPIVERVIALVKGIEIPPAVRAALAEADANE